jgi:hypothetical protein
MQLPQATVSRRLVHDSKAVTVASEQHSGEMDHKQSTTLVRLYVTKAEILAKVNRLTQLKYAFSISRGRPARGVRPGIPALARSLGVTPQKASTIFHRLDEQDFAGFYVTRLAQQIPQRDNPQHQSSQRPPQVPTVQPAKSRLDRLR